MFDAAPVTDTIVDLIIAGVAERELLAAVARLFPEMTPTELLGALQIGQAAAERKALRSQ